MIDEPSVRDEAKDEFFEHLRKQDAEIAAMREDISFLVEVSENLKGFALFCRRWGGRISKLLRWLAVVGPGLALLWQWFSAPIVNLFHKGG